MVKFCQNENLNNLKSYLQAIEEPNRLRILCLLKKGKLCVCEIFKHLSLPQNLTSHHLKILRDAELVLSKKNGLNVMYKRNEKKIEYYQKLLSKIVNL
ncbi:metalloregulator ArsR/SmtB family transcription factor [Patescibacteria group bacterium]|nr:metalloregulator ArsR/SmtB family transcription factor [Patescibacteria group bacterium]